MPLPLQSPTPEFDAWDYTRRAEEHIGDELAGRPAIVRDSPISGGVQYGLYGGEAIVVDPYKYPVQYDRYYDDAQERATDKGRIDRKRVLRAAYDTVRDNMRYDQAAVDRTLLTIAKRRGDAEFEDFTPVELSLFMKLGFGVCRHQELVNGVILEKFKSDGVLTGNASSERNHRPGSGHAWTRYTNRRGEVIISDPAQGYFGYLKDAPRNASWDYFRPGERIAEVGTMALRGRQLQPRPPRN